MSEERANYGNENIVRVQKDARYFVASNIPFNDERLSWEARGVMGYLLSKPNDWETRMADLVNKGPSGMKMIRRILAELRRAGYMSRKRIQVAHGEFRWITTLYESPELNKSSILPLGIDGAGIDAQRVDIVNTESPNTDRAARAKIVKSADKTVDYILENEHAAQSSWQGREKLPPAIRDLADEFVSVTGIKPAKRELSFWLGELSDWLSFGVLRPDVRAGIDYAKEHNFSVMTPASLTKTVRMIAANRVQTRSTPPPAATAQNLDDIKAIPFSQWKAQQVTA